MSKTWSVSWHPINMLLDMSCLSKYVDIMSDVTSIHTQHSIITFNTKLNYVNLKLYDTKILINLHLGSKLSRVQIFQETISTI